MDIFSKEYHSTMEILTNFSKGLISHCIERFAGKYLENEIKKEQISGQVFQRHGELCDLDLKCDTFNEMLSEHSSLEFSGGHIENLSLTLGQWNLLNPEPKIRVIGLDLEFQPKYQTKQEDSQPGGSEDSFSKEEPTDKCVSVPLIKGIDFAVAGLKVELRDTKITLIHSPPGANHGVGIEIKIDLIEFSNDSNNTKEKCGEKQQYDIYRVEFSEINCYMFEFVISPDKSCMRNESDHILICKLSGKQEFIFKSKRTDSLPGLMSCVEISIGNFIAFLSPRQLKLLVDMINSFVNPEVSEKKSSSSNTKINEEPQNLFGNAKLSCNSNKICPGLNWTQSDCITDDILQKSDDKNSSDSTIYTSAYSSQSNESENLFSSSLSTAAIPENGVKASINFNCHTSNIIIFILQEDILVFNFEQLSLTKPSVSTMNEISVKFFKEIENSQFFDDETNFVNSKMFFEHACTHDHLRITGSNLDIECKTNSIDLSVTNFDVLECIVASETQETEYITLLSFMKNFPVTHIPPYYKIENKPDLVVNINKVNNKQTDVMFTLQQCWSEVDLSMCDRFSTILNMKSLWCKNPQSTNMPTRKLVDDSTNNRLNLKINSAYHILKFRFPIPDLRPDVDKSQFLWWKRSVRKDILYFTQLNTHFETELKSGESILDFNLESEMIKIYFKEGDSDTPIPVIESFQNSDDSLRLKVSCKPTGVYYSAKSDEETVDTDEMETIVTIKKDTTPFVKNSYSCCGDEDSETKYQETYIQPSPEGKLKEFIDTAKNNSHLHIELVLPDFKIRLESKQSFEVLYNRISDLSLWQSSIRTTDFNFDNLNSTQFCKSDLNLDSSIEYSDAEDEDYDQNKQDEKLNKVTIEIKIVNGIISIYPNLKDSSGKIVPDKYGRLQLALKNVNIFNITDYKGIPQHNYVCWLIDNMRLSHAAVCEKGSNSEILRHIIYKNEDGMYHSRANSKSLKMFIGVVKNNIDDNNEKNICVSCQLNGVTLRHFVAEPEHLWYKQLTNFFDVVRYPVEGYDAKTPQVELYINFDESAIDYRPIHLDTKCVIYLGTLGICYNHFPNTKVIKCRIVTEQCNFFLSKKSNLLPVNLIRDYVSIIDLDMFELTLSFGNKNFETLFTASSGVINIRTCIDSAHALVQLMSYFTQNGDINETGLVEEEQVSLEPYFEYPSASEGADENDISKELELAIRDAMADFTEPEENKMVPIFVKEMDEVVKEEVIYNWGDSSDEDSGFTLLDYDSKRLPKQNAVVMSYCAKPDEIKCLDDYFAKSKEPKETSKLDPPKYFPDPVQRFLLQEINLIISMFGGNDFTNSIKKNPKTPTGKKTDDSPKSNTKPKSEKKNIKKLSSDWFKAGGPDRMLETCMEIELRKVTFQHDIYPETKREASRSVLFIHTFEITDKLKSSAINKFLYAFTTEQKPRLSHRDMMVLKFLKVRPDKRKDVLVAHIIVSLLPLRLNIDQTSFEFLMDFVCDLQTLYVKDSMVQVKLDTVSKIDPIGKATNNPHDDSKLSKKPTKSSLYIQKFTFSPALVIIVDYVSGSNNLIKGRWKNVLLDLTNLNRMTITLKRLEYIHGILGFDELFKTILADWAEDIKKNQLTSVIAGVGVMNDITNIIYGIMYLFWLPIEQYQKDGRIWCGFQKGAKSFIFCSGLASLDLISSFVRTIQSLAEIFHDIVSPSPSGRILRLRNKSSFKALNNSQPADFREGMMNAYRLVAGGINESAETLYITACSEAEQRGTVSAVGRVLRQVPFAVINPMICTLSATSNVLGGCKNQFSPASRSEACKKWKPNFPK